MAKKGLIIKQVELNNKSRKGIYAYIKGVGRRGSYYKIKKDMSLKNNLNDYLKAYEGKVRSKKQGVSKVTPMKLYKKLTKDQPLIENLIKKGIWKTQLKNASTQTPIGIKGAYKKLLKKAVLSNDNETLDLLIQDSNIQKLKHRFEFKINILDGAGATLVALNHLGKKDLEEIMSDMKKYFGKGRNVKDNYVKDLKSIQASGYTYNHKNNGIAIDFEITILMRKGK